ncbi:hypothetical protein D3C76_1576560 [compost metagenome]
MQTAKGVVLKLAAKFVIEHVALLVIGERLLFVECLLLFECLPFIVEGLLGGVALEQAIGNLFQLETAILFVGKVGSLAVAIGKLGGATG